MFRRTLVLLALLSVSFSTVSSPEMGVMYEIGIGTSGSQAADRDTTRLWTRAGRTASFKSERTQLECNIETLRFSAEDVEVNLTVNAIALDASALLLQERRTLPANVPTTVAVVSGGRRFEVFLKAFESPMPQTCTKCQLRAAEGDVKEGSTSQE